MCVERFFNVLETRSDTLLVIIQVEVEILKIKKPHLHLYYDTQCIELYFSNRKKICDRNLIGCVYINLALKKK